MDLRIEKTYRALLAAFTKLLETNRYEDVTVAMLCDEAMIRRTTFYKHFSDKAEFFAFFIESLRINLLKYGEDAVSADNAGIAILQALAEFMLEHETLVDNIFKSSMTGMMMLVMVDEVAEAIRERFRDAFVEDKASPLTLTSTSEFAAGGIVRLLETWWTSGHSREGERQMIVVADQLIARALGVKQR